MRRDCSFIRGPKVCRAATVAWHGDDGCEQSRAKPLPGRGGKDGACGLTVGLVGRRQIRKIVMRPVTSVLSQTGCRRRRGAWSAGGPGFRKGVREALAEQEPPGEDLEERKRDHTALRREGVPGHRGAEARARARCRDQRGDWDRVLSGEWRARIPRGPVSCARAAGVSRKWGASRGFWTEEGHAPVLALKE